MGSWPLKYLGLPLGVNPRAANFWCPVVEKVERRLEGWSKALFVKREKDDFNLIGVEQFLKLLLVSF